MRARRVVSEPKRILNEGAWKTGKISSSAFPLSRSPIKLGAAWNWRVVRLEAISGRYRLLIAYRLDKQKFMAWLGREVGAELAIIARLEDHDDEGFGLHCHAMCRQGAEIPVGRQVYPDMIRVPRFGRPHRRVVELSEMTAWQLALEFYRIQAPRAGAML